MIVSAWRLKNQYIYIVFHTSKPQRINFTHPVPSPTHTAGTSPDNQSNDTAIARLLRYRAPRAQGGKLISILELQQYGFIVCLTYSSIVPG